MPKDYIPSPDSLYRDWMVNLLGYASAHAVELGTTVAEVAAQHALYDVFDADYGAHVTAQAAAQAARQAKDASRSASEEGVRGLVRKIQANPNVTDAQRESLGITVPDRSKTPVPPPSTAPLALVNNAQRLLHILRIADEANPTRFAKPDGAMGCEVLCKIGGETPVDDSGMITLGIATRSKFTATFDAADANQVAHYILRWVNTRGEKGPLSDPIAARIAA